MADRTKTKAERRQEAGHAAKAERKQAKLRRKERGGAQAAEPVGADGPGADGIESRLASLEKAVAAQSELSERLLQKLDEVLEEARNRGA